MAEALGTSKRMLLYYFTDRGDLLAQALDANRPKVGEIFRGISTKADFCDAARALWHGLTHGDQRRSVRMLLQVLSLATTDPDTYGSYARTAVAVMLDPISDALVAVGFPARRGTGARHADRVRTEGPVSGRPGHRPTLPGRRGRRNAHRCRGQVTTGRAQRTPADGALGESAVWAFFGTKHALVERCRDAQLIH
jgi:AcrR family transcriptional regulator